MDAGTGYYLLKPFRDFLFIRTFGYWDGRTAASFAGDAKKTILAEFLKRPWCVLHDAREWQLGTPEVEEIISGFVTSNLSGTLSYHALVTGPSELKQWQVNRMFNKITAYSHRRFDHMEEAREWLMSAGFTIPDLPDP